PTPGSGSWPSRFPPGSRSCRRSIRYCKEDNMPNQQPLDTLRTHLLRRGLPRHYVRRVVGELEDHQQDLLDEQTILPTDSGTAPTPHERLGDLTALTDRIVAEYQSRRFAGRHPVLAFVVAPIPLALAFWIIVLLSFVLAEEALFPLGR